MDRPESSRWRNEDERRDRIRSRDNYYTQKSRRSRSPDARTSRATGGRDRSPASYSDRQRHRRHASSRERRPAPHNRRHRSRSLSDSDDDRRETSSRHDRRTSKRSRSRDRSRDRRRLVSPLPKRRRRSMSRSRSPPPQRSRKPLPTQNETFRGDVQPLENPDAPPKQKPNFKPTGLLAKEANTVAGTKIVLKYHEPAEARKPPSKHQWRMYVFKKNDLLDTLHLHERSAWLIGRDQHVTDYLLEHPSVSKQHAVIQFRYITTTNEYGDKEGSVKPYLIDLESANGTRLNGSKVEASRYVELVDTDVIAFGDSEREYVMMLPAPDK